MSHCVLQTTFLSRAGYGRHRRGGEMDTSPSSTQGLALPAGITIDSQHSSRKMGFQRLFMITAESVGRVRTVLGALTRPSRTGEARIVPRRSRGYRITF